MEWKGYLIAYHAVPDRFLTVADLAALKGDGRYLKVGRCWVKHVFASTEKYGLGMLTCCPCVMLCGSSHVRLY
jgi:hypothetical protein